MFENVDIVVDVFGFSEAISTSTQIVRPSLGMLPDWGAAEGARRMAEHKQIRNKERINGLFAHFLLISFCRETHISTQAPEGMRVKLIS
jgi:hypothetical protein